LSCSRFSRRAFKEMVIEGLLSDNIIRCQSKKENPTTPYQTPSLNSGVVRPFDSPSLTPIELSASLLDPSQRISPKDSGKLTHPVRRASEAS
jgi:hypothetical protein